MRLIGIEGCGEKKKKALTEFAEFIGVDSIEYKDSPNGQNGEDYILTKGCVSKTIRVRGNIVDGSFANFS